MRFLNSAHSEEPGCNFSSSHVPLIETPAVNTSVHVIVYVVTIRFQVNGEKDEHNGKFPNPDPRDASTSG